MKSAFILFAIFVNFLIGDVYAKGVIADGLYAFYLQPSTLTTLARYDLTQTGFIWDFSQNGDLKSQYSYINGKIEGLALGYYETGEIHYKRYYKEGKLDGVSRQYYRNGELYSEIPFRAGQPHGPARFYESNGILKKIAVFHRGKITEVRDLAGE